MPETEERARQMGWLPKEEFRGNPENWVEAGKYVERAETSLPFLKGTMHKLEETVRSQKFLLEKQAEEMGGLRQDMTEFVEFSRGAEERAYQKALKDLRVEQASAKAKGDLDAFADATEKIDSLINEHPAVTGKEREKGKEPVQPQGPQTEYTKWFKPEVLEQWKGEHTWFETEPDMAIYADQAGRFLLGKDGFNKPHDEHLKEVAKLVKKKFPEYFGNTAQKKGSPVEGDTGGSPSSNGKKTYADLPPDAKTICDKWTGKDGQGKTGSIPGLTREQYLKDYKWQ